MSNKSRKVNTIHSAGGLRIAYSLNSFLRLLGSQLVFLFL